MPNFMAVVQADLGRNHASVRGCIRVQEAQGARLADPEMGLLDRYCCDDPVELMEDYHCERRTTLWEQGRALSATEAFKQDGHRKKGGRRTKTIGYC